mgnify:CR=1 FL=1
MTYQQRVYNTAAPRVGDLIARFIVAQGAQESANYTSSLFKKYNAAFGYMYNKDSKYQVKAGSKADNNAAIAAYANIEDATKEVCDWLLRRTKDRRGGFPSSLSALDTPGKYVAAIKAAGYFEGPESVYAKNVAYYFEKLGKFVQTNSGLVSVVALLLVLYFVIK